jgi:hypothetical protein
LWSFWRINFADEERVAAYWHDRRVEAGTLAPPWFDPVYDGEVLRVRVLRNITNWGRDTSNRWLLSQLAVTYSGHPCGTTNGSMAWPTTTVRCEFGQSSGR